ncbi:hypothetical protein [Azospirillum sp. ST 5-10]|uniref:hypothetical protein n=1 Tax=unclassified Azospirillum TaxID=2630922 RepID=UPI003F4A3A41
MNSDGGYTRLYRRMWDHPAFRNYAEAGVFAWMVSAAQWRDGRVGTKFGPVDLRVGELIIAERVLAEDFGLHRNTLRALIQRLVDDGTIALFRDRCPHRAGTVVRIENYAEYQGVVDGYKPQQDRSGTESRTEEGPKEDRSGTKNKEGNQGKEGNIDSPLSPPEGGRSPDGEPLAEPDLGLEDIGQPATGRRRATSRGTRVPDGDLPDEWAAAANHSRERHELPLLSRRVLGLRWESFQNFWRGRPGSKGLKIDWRATWLNDAIDPRTEQKFPPDAGARLQAKQPMFDTTG